MSSKLPIIVNTQCQKSGHKSYVHLIRKYRFNPTKPGPYAINSTLHQTGRPYTNKPIGGRATIRHVLQKRKGGADAQDFERLGVDDAQNDSLGELVEIRVGSPGQSLAVGVDTGMGDFWVWSTELSTAITSQYKGHRVFDQSKSGTFNSSAPRSSWSVSYADESSVSGIVGSDNVDLGGLTIKDQSVQLADNISPGLLQGAGDGVLGLGFESFNPATSPVQNILARGEDIPKSSQLFTANLGRWGNNQEAFYTFGFIDEATVRSTGQEIFYTPVNNSEGFWGFDSPSVTVNVKSISRSGNKAIIDTGTPLALLDDRICQTIYDAIPGAVYDFENQGYIFPSNAVDDGLPTISLAVGEKEFVVQKGVLKFADVKAKPGYVYGGFQSRGSLGFDILGHVFLKNVYAVFDIGNLRFGAVQGKAL